MAERKQITCSLAKPWYCENRRFGGETQYYKVNPLFVIDAIKRGYPVAAILDKPHAVIVYPANAARKQLQLK